MDRPRRAGAGARPSLGQRIRRWLRPPRTLHPTRAGWIFFALIFGVGFAALNTGNNLLYLVLAFMLSFLVLSGVLSESCLRGISISRRLPHEIFARSGAPVAIEIRNAQTRVPAFALVIEDFVQGPGERAPHAAGRVFALRVGPDSSELRTYPLVAPRRGRLHLSGFRVSTRFPFGLFSKALSIEAPQDVLVYPAVDPASVTREPETGPREGPTPAGRQGSGTEVSGLREYAHGDPWGRVHWRASLRRGELLVRDAESDRRDEVQVHLRTRGQTDGRFEQTVMDAASEVVAFLDSGLRVALSAERKHFDPGDGPRHRARLLSYLALVEPEAAA